MSNVHERMVLYLPAIRESSTIVGDRASDLAVRKRASQLRRTHWSAIIGYRFGALFEMHRHHDLGGRPAGPVEHNEHDYALWEKRVDALLSLLRVRDLIAVDELRRNIEELGAEAYDRLSYYERWMHSIAQTMIQRGVISIDELGRKMAEVEARAKRGEL